MTKEEYITWLVNKISTAKELGGMELEIWAFQQCLKQAKKIT